MRLGLFSQIKSLLVFLLLTSCAQLPDVQHAKQSLKEGETQSAVRELVNLSNRGFPDAKLVLGDHFIKQSSVTDWKKAEQYYSEILAQDHRARLRMGKVYRKYNSYQPDSQLFHKSAEYFLEGVSAGDDLSLGPLIDLYLDNPKYLTKDIPIKTWISDLEITSPQMATVYLARYFALDMNQNLESRAKVIQLCRPQIVASKRCQLLLGRALYLDKNEPALESLVLEIKQLLEQNQLDHESVFKLAKGMLQGAPLESESIDRLIRLSASQYPDAHATLMKMYLTQGVSELSHEDSSKLIAIADSGNSKARYLVGRLYFKGIWFEQNPKLAEQYLLPVADSVSGAAYILGLIYRDGWLGEADVNRALDYLLSAARQGAKSADRELAKMFWVQKGVQMNPVYAYSFAKISASQGAKNAERQFIEISNSLTPEQLMEGDALAERELSERQKLRAQRTTQLEISSGGDLVVLEQ